MKNLPPTQIQWEQVPKIKRWYLFFLVYWYCALPKLACPPAPVHFAILSSLCMFLLLPVVPHHPMSIPIVIGGGLAGGLFISGIRYIPEWSSHGRKV
jgi:hypothetical protein